MSSQKGDGENPRAGRGTERPWDVLGDFTHASLVHGRGGGATESNTASSSGHERGAHEGGGHSGERSEGEESARLHLE